MRYGDLDQFWAGWWAPEAESKCDSLGGSQFRRALCDWINAGMPIPARTWISLWLAADDKPPVAKKKGKK